MTPKAAHNAVAAVVEMYAEALTEMHAREAALISEVGKLRASNTELQRQKDVLETEVNQLHAAKETSHDDG